MPFLDKQNKPFQYIAIRTDISDRKEAEREAEAARKEAIVANHAKSEFLATMSHELRTPLTSSLGSLGLLNSMSFGELSEQGVKLVEIALRNNQSLLRLVNDLLDFEKILSGTLQVETSRHDISELTSKTIRDNQGYAQSQAIKFHFKDEGSSLYAKVQEHRFEQVLNNLLSNAAKFSESGSDVGITVNLVNENVVVGVRDSGPGIPEEFKSRIFDRFTQADSSSTREQGGTGLGLSISRSLTEAMGGTISFETEVGVGTTFYIRFPAC